MKDMKGKCRKARGRIYALISYTNFAYSVC